MIKMMRCGKGGRIKSLHQVEFGERVFLFFFFFFVNHHGRLKDTITFSVTVIRCHGVEAKDKLEWW